MVDKMIELSVCIGSACHMKGAQNVVATFQHLIEEYNVHDKVELRATFCMKMCSNPGVSVAVNGEKYNIPANTARDFFKEKVLGAIEG